MKNERHNLNTGRRKGGNIDTKDRPKTFRLERDGENESVWQSGLTFNDAGVIPYNPNRVYDALVVGAGITGLTTALLLQRQGIETVVADAYNVGFGTSGGTTAHINTFADTTFAEVEKAFDFESSRLFATAISEAVAIISEHVNTYKIDCDFEWKKGYVYAEDEKQVRQLDSLFQSALKVGVKASETTTVPISFPYQKAVVFENQAQFHPLKYILGLQKEFLALGGAFLEDTRIGEIDDKEGYFLAHSKTTSIKAKRVVYATHLPIGGINPLHFLCAPYRSYAMAVKLVDGKYPDGLVYDMQEPYHYFRTHLIDGEPHMIVGGNDHKTGHGDPEQAFVDLEKYIRQHYHIKSIGPRWSAQYYVPADGLPYIGASPASSKGMYVATGYNGNGMMFGTIAGKVISDIILGKKNEFIKLFDPGRVKPIAGFSEIVRENADVAYHFIADRLVVGDLGSLKDIQAGTGSVVEYKDRKLGIYKEEDGTIHAVNPVCPHAKCIVDWNNAEKSWDCPCHGARYDKDGNVLTGPARKNLEKVKVD